MKYEIYREHVESWSDNHKDLNENYRFQLLMEVLKKNNSINGLGTYVNTKVVEEFRNTTKQTIENVVNEEKMNANVDLFVLMMMMSDMLILP